MSAIRMEVTATGMVSSVGLSAAAACAAMRAGLSAFEALPYRDNHVRKSITGSRVPVLPNSLGRDERLIDLMAMAIEDALRGEAGTGWEQLPLLVAVSEPGRPGGGAAMAGELVARVEGRLERRFHPGLSRVLTGGSAAGFHALEAARKVLGERRAAACLVCGVDSFLNARSLLWLEEHGRLKTQRNADGVIPGEAAACVRVELRAGASRQPLATVEGLGFAREIATVLNEEPLRADGLVQAGRTALEESKLRMQDVAVRLSDVSGELYAFKEQTLTLTRLLRVKRESLPLWLCAESIGEVGAAASLCQLVRVAQAWQRGYAPGAWAMCFASSVSGERAVAVVRRPKQAGEACR